MFILRSGLTSIASHPDRDFCRGGGKDRFVPIVFKGVR